MRIAAVTLMIALTLLMATLTVRLWPAPPSRRAVYNACMHDAANTYEALAACVEKANR